MKRSIFKIGFIIILLSLELYLPQPVKAAAGDISTIAGTGGMPVYGGDGGPATSAQLNYPGGVAVDSLGNIFIADTENHRVRKVDHTTGIISTVSGNGTAGYSGDGSLASNALLNYPWGVTVDPTGNLYIADSSNNCIRKIDQATGIISTVSGNGTGGYSGDGGPAASALFYYPRGVTVDPTGNLYIADTENNRVRKIDHTTGNISTVSGNGTAGYSGDGGPAITALLRNPRDVTVDPTGNLYIADTYNNRIRKIDQATGIIWTIAGVGRMDFSGDGGPATSACLNLPYSVTLSPSGNLFIADFVNHRIRKVDASGTISTIAGSGPIGQWGSGGHMVRYPSGSGCAGDGGPATSAFLWCPTSIAIDSTGNLLIADSYNHRIRKVDRGVVIITPVISSVSAPDDNSKYRSANMPPIFSGSAADGYGGTGLAANSTVFTIQRTSTLGNYWNGTGWNSSPTWLATTHSATSGNISTTWTSNIALPLWEDDKYIVQSKTTNQNNLSYPGMPIIFYYDNTPPTASVTIPVNGSNYNSAIMPVSFSGTVADNSKGLGVDLSSTVFSLQRSVDSKYWNCLTWSDTLSWLSTYHHITYRNHQDTWTSTIVFPSWTTGVYSIQVRATDIAGNTFLTSPVTFTYTMPTNTMPTKSGNVAPGPVTMPSTPVPSPEPILTPTPVSTSVSPTAVSSPRKLQVNIGGQIYSVSSTGQIDDNAVAFSPDRKISILLPRGTSIMAGNNPPADLTIAPANSSPLPPVDKKIIGIPYQCLPDGTIFQPPVDLTWGYDPTQLPEGTDETSIQLVFYNEAARNWEIIPGTVDVVNHTMKAKISHFTIYAMMAQYTVVSTTSASLVQTNPGVTGSGLLNVPSPLAPLPASERSIPLQQAAPINTGLLIGLIILAVLVVMAIVILVIRRRNS
jgi:sugar lactone lactonase YvrE